MANEADFLELLVANERVGRWMDMLMDPFQRGRCVNQHPQEVPAALLLLRFRCSRSILNSILLMGQDKTTLGLIGLNCWTLV